jgi:hypothetical protein
MTTTSETWAPPTEFAEQCRELYGLECPPWWGTPRRLEHKTLGGKAAAVMERLGYPPMPWQRYVLDVALELDPVTGLFVYRKVGLSVPRQQGKTQQLLAVMIHRTMAWQRQNVIYAAQTRSMARTRWEDEFWASIEDSKLRTRFSVRKANGHEAIINRATRSRLGITSNTEKAGHGPSLDMGVIDEAFAHEDDRLEQAFSPAMLTKPMAQLWWASAGGTDRGVWLLRQRQLGRELIEQLWNRGVWSRVAYFEWFAPEDLPRDQPSTWRICMPALGHTVTEDTVRGELESMEAPEFDRAYLNRTRKPQPAPDVNVPREKWGGLTDADSKAGELLAFGVDVSPMRDWASIAVASHRPDGRLHLELVDRRPGLDWVVPALVRLRELWNPVAIALDVPSRAPAGSLLDPLAAAGLHTPTDPERPERGDLLVTRLGELVAACGQIADAIRQGDIVHRDQAPLTAAVNGARTRPLGDAWAFTRRTAQVDISPLVAATLARWALIARAEAADDYDPLDSVF